MRVQSGGMPHLTPESALGSRILLGKDYPVAGYEPTCGFRFDDPCVPRAHAAPWWRAAVIFSPAWLRIIEMGRCARGFDL